MREIIFDTETTGLDSQADRVIEIGAVELENRFPTGRTFHEYIHPDGRAITLATLGEGDIVGELAMLDGEVRSASVETLGGDGELLALPAGDVRSLLERHPEITVKFVAALTRRLRAANERISRQSFQTVPSRVAGVLSQMAADESEDGRQVTIRMNQADLAQLAGTSRESVSRFLADLERSGVVKAGRGQVTILEPARLGNYIF